MANTSAIAAGVAFVALAAINMLVMLEASQPSCSAATRNRLIAVHRTSGYLFVILLCIMAYSMSQRLAGVGITGHLPTHLVSRPGDFVNANPLLRIGVSPAERFC
jgi:hypothetical protein